MMGVPAVYNVLYGGTPAHNLATIIPITNGDNAGLMTRRRFRHRHGAVPRA
jgi:hypothetical protein